MAARGQPANRAGANPPSADPPPEVVRSHVEKILASAVFARSARHQQFLRFVVEEKLAGRSDGIKETSLAVRIFGRKPSFDPRIDSIVRVEARGVRGRLREYYATEGAADTMAVELPVGSYVPLFKVRSADGCQPAGRDPQPAMLRTARPKLLVAGTLALAALCATLPFRFGAPNNTIAILPLANLGGGDLDVFCQGLTEDVTTELARFARLKVIARTSASRFQSKSADVREIGRKLGVAAIVEGSVRSEGGRVRVTAQLIDAATGYHKWSEAYDRDARELLAAEGDIVSSIVDAVTRNLGARDVSAASPDHLPPAGARDLFWRARYLRGQRTAAARRQAAELLEEAVRGDDRYVQAWSALASLDTTRLFHGEGAFEELAAKTRLAASKTIALDQRDPDAQSALALLEWLHDHDWRAADRRFRRNLENSPSCAAGHSWYSMLLLALGRFDQSLSELRRADALNPLGFLVSNDEATVLYCARRYDQAAARARRSLAVDPRFFFARITLGASAAATDRYAEAIREFRLVPVEGRGSVLGHLGHALARHGERAEAESLLRELESSGGGVHAAYIRIGLNDSAGALDELERAFASYETDLNFLAVEPIFDPLRGEPRYLALRQKLGI
jgi:TolB-like protein/Tfp pilus assembly protein PilF